MSLSIRVLGSGTSSGVPTIGCDCAVCLSDDPRDTRLRPSILIHHEGRNIVIDTTPDFRAQMLAAKISRLDAIVYTHAHADHILGLDDVRPFNYRQGRIPIFSTQNTFDTIRRVFAYAFDEKRGEKSHVPQLDVQIIDAVPFDVLGLRFEPIPLLHGNETIYGYRFGNAAYLTDHSEIPAESRTLLQGLDVLFLDALRHKPHPTHTTLEDAVKLARELKARRTYFTHMSHDLGQRSTEESLPQEIRLAYDGLEIEVAA